MNGNPPPTAADNTVTTDEDVAYAFQAGDLNFTDDVNADDELASVTIVRLLTAGALSLDGTEVTADQEVTRAQLDAGQLTDTPPPNATAPAMAPSADGVNESRRPIPDHRRDPGRRPGYRGAGHLGHGAGRLHANG